MFGGKVSGYQLTIEAMLGSTSSDNGKVTLSCLSSESYVLSLQGCGHRQMFAEHVYKLSLCD